MYIVLYRMGFRTYVGYYKPTMIKIRIRMCIENRPDQKLNTNRSTTVYHNFSRLIRSMVQIRIKRILRIYDYLRSIKVYII